MFFLNKSLLFVLLILTGNTYGLPEPLPVFISLGGDCQVSFALKAHELRQVAYPFDWMMALNFDGVCRVIENRFKDFLNPHYLKHGINSVINTYYEILFMHDFPTISKAEWMTGEDTLLLGHVVDNFLDDVDNVSQKYTRRINRFLQLLEGPSKVVFIRTHITPNQAQSFVTMMAKNYPLSDYLLLAVHGDPSLDYYWNIARVESFYAQQKHSDPAYAIWDWFHDDEWKKLFIKSGFIQPRSSAENRQ